jgi:hypothetical protein
MCLPGTANHKTIIWILFHAREEGKQPVALTEK